jgi:hypothetical protein
MSRASDFHVGQRVKMTPSAIQNHLQGRAKTTLGTVRRIGTTDGSYASLTIFVQRDGLKSIDSYHCDFWEPTNAKVRTFAKPRAVRG